MPLKKMSLMALLAALALPATLPVAASVNDFKEQIKVSADKENIDLKNNKVIFSGNVSVVQGSLSILADRLEVERTDVKGSEVFIATGRPATYQQVLEDGKPISAQAKIIRYEVGSRTLVLVGTAQLKQNDSQVNGETIRYNLDKQQLEAKGSGSQTRVTAIFMQDKEPKKTDPAKPTKPTKPENEPPSKPADKESDQ